jgi:hypothetical protein
MTIGAVGDAGSNEIKGTTLGAKIQGGFSGLDVVDGDLSDRRLQQFQGRSLTPSS